ncbi:uncharacterized protein [Nicotiana tomentosiformis]|uniref:uncharacterized protein n=1 Tax=Nicotiana tomentosiformis TaxID=4098 RepID=UPI00388C5253
MAFLVHVVSSEGIKVDPKTIEDGGVIAYVPHQLNPHEKKYAVHDLELANYDITNLYHSGKTNMIADALSRKAESMVSLAFILAVERHSAVDVQHDGAKEVTIGHDGVLRLQGRVFVPNVDGLRELIFEEASSLQYSILEGRVDGATNMYHDLKQHYCWRKIRKNIVGHIAQCLNCHHVKYEY